jgi:foldase protein PrsA
MRRRLTRLYRTVLALGAFFVLAVAIAACGDSVPGNAVAKVGDKSISKTTYNHWLGIAAKGQAQSAPGGSAQLPDAPNFTTCIATKKRTLPKPPKGQKAPTDAQLKTQCKQEYDALRDQVMQFLITSEWIQGEAADQNVKVTSAEVQTQFAKTRKQSFPKDADFQKFLKSSGMSLQDVLFRVRIDTLANKVRDKVTKGKGTVTTAQINAYYAKNKSRFAQPERRDLLVVLTKTKAKAAQAQAALQSGQAFKAVAKKFSIDQSSKAQGGKLLGISKGQSEKALDDAVFKAPKNKLTGPVKTQFGYYVFKVTKVTKASQQTLAQATPTIRQLLTTQGQQKAITAFVTDFRKRWHGRTNCASGYVTQDCKNAPKPKTNTSTVPPGAAPSGGTTPTPTPAAPTPPTTTP